MYRAVPVLENQTLTSFLNAKTSFKAGCTAGRAFFAAVRRRLRRIGALTFLDEKFLFNAVIEVIPREDLIKAALTVCVERRVYAEIFKDLHPRVKIEAVRPAVKVHAALMGLQNNGVQFAVTAREHGFEKTCLRAVVVDCKLTGECGLTQECSLFNC